MNTAPGVWYTFTGDGAIVTLNTCTGTSYDSKIGVFSGTCAALVCVTGNDDFCGLQSQVNFTSVIGTTYYVLVTGFGTASGAFTLTRTCVYPCTIALSSAPGTDAQSVCKNNAITNITYNTTVSTGATFTGLPAGVTGNWAANVVTISGTPSIAGVYNYTVTLVGCPSATTATGTITVSEPNVATISYPGSPYCSTVPAVPVVRTGTAGGTYSAAPAGLTINPATGTVSPQTSTAGTYTVTYSMAANGCPAASTTTTITITAAPNIIIFYAGNPYCSNSGTANVTRFGTPGGTYSSTAGLSITPATGAVNLGWKHARNIYSNLHGTGLRRLWHHANNNNDHDHGSTNSHDRIHRQSILLQCRNSECNAYGNTRRRNLQFNSGLNDQSNNGRNNAG
ncbi:MAG: hypothetical protein IPL84_16895 [Chitinophagaceae bacterium]|nr:hypothetical protein [Chitinophagaceae bacterium]